MVTAPAGSGGGTDTTTGRRDNHLVELVRYIVWLRRLCDHLEIGILGEGDSHDGRVIDLLNNSFDTETLVARQSS